LVLDIKHRPDEGFQLLYETFFDIVCIIAVKGEIISDDSVLISAVWLNLQQYIYVHSK
jgi:hypothetical protein